MPMSPRRFGQADKPQKRHNWQDDRIRGNRHARGYGDDWCRLRSAYLQEHPLCEPCESRGVIQDAAEVHHLEPFNGLDDPLRLDWENLQSICRRCHQHITGGRKRKGGGHH